VRNQPRHYLVEGDSRRYLCFRTEWVEEPHRGISGRRLLLWLVPDLQTQHFLDVLTIYADDPRLRMERDPDKVWPGP
jgi:hypothetical protein